jgi:hypothetical protein
MKRIFLGLILVNLILTSKKKETDPPLFGGNGNLNVYDSIAPSLIFRLIMKNIKVFIYSFILLNLYSCLDLSAQTEAEGPGYIICTNGDSLTGTIKLGKPGTNGYIYVKIFDEQDKKVKLRADKVKYFVMDERLFESIMWRGSSYYYEKIVSGKTTLYKTEYFIPDNSTISGNGTPAIIVVPGKEEHVQYFLKDEKKFIHLYGNFKKYLAEYTKDCPELSKKITESKFKDLDIKETIIRYNNCGD